MTQHLWFVRRRGDITGPFPAGQLRELFSDGDLDLRDEVSLDGNNWLRLIESDILEKPHQPEPVPPAVDEEWRQEREKAKQRWRDESPEAMADLHVDSEQAVEHLRHVEQETRDMLDARTKKRPALVGGLVTILVLILVGLGVWRGQSGGFDIRADSTPRVRNCNQPPSEGVIWSGCAKNDATLRKANLRNADLKGVHFERTDLSGADLSYADLQTADLRGANLSGAVLKGANLSQVDLTGADLAGADLGFAVLAGALVDGVRFDGASLRKATWVDGQVCGDQSVGSCQ